jgi:hypothetical protein
MTDDNEALNGAQAGEPEPFHSTEISDPFAFLTERPRLCEHCHQRDGTELWAGDHDRVSIARNPRLLQRWCRRCTLEAQIAVARASAARLADLEAALAKEPE